MSNDDHQVEQERKKQCPFGVYTWCSEDCPLNVELTQQLGGLVKKMKMCSLPAMVMLLSDLNNKITVKQHQKQQIHLPHLRAS